MTFVAEFSDSLDSRQAYGLLCDAIWLSDHLVMNCDTNRSRMRILECVGNRIWFDILADCSITPKERPLVANHLQAEAESLLAGNPGGWIRISSL